MDLSDKLAQRREAKKSYGGKPRFRKAAVLQQILATSFGIPILISMCMSYLIPILEPVIGRVGILGLLGSLMVCMIGGVLFVCAMTLTGPVYKNQIDVTTKDLETWGFADRGAALVISGLAIAGLMWVALRLVGGISH
ncbi:hypothetical protein RISK_005030 [Rhodopirellula islandica]|uniref:Transmembrane protein n=1 Tax=Rhodopirellula islandica TaxID=595434 RepID=A0A0J1EAU7_RHOIS|nr:hypothetical protein [Rhodopirellula islandica]KLU02734.1 hypothetical protein RISK_005030 [Rhodopirellula islandica]